VAQPNPTFLKLGQLLDVFAPDTSPIEALTKASTVTAAAIHAVATATMSGANGNFTVYEHYVVAIIAIIATIAPLTPPYVLCRGRSHPPDLCSICYAPILGLNAGISPGSLNEK
jgi:hypothetical protein